MLRTDPLCEQVRVALLQNEMTRDAGIEVFHRNGILLLWGEVATEEIAEAAEVIASRQQGVLKVINDLAVDEPEDEEYWPRAGSGYA
ncbi:MAG: BON domain-containing protein [Bacteroidota bacterium]